MTLHDFRTRTIHQDRRYKVLCMIPFTKKTKVVTGQIVRIGKYICMINPPHKRYDIHYHRIKMIRAIKSNIDKKAKELKLTSH